MKKRLVPFLTALVLITMIASLTTQPAMALQKGDNKLIAKQTQIAEPVTVPEGMTAIVEQGGRSFRLVHGSLKDLVVIASDGHSILRPRNPQGAQVLGAARNAFMAEGTSMPVKACTGGYEAGGLVLTGINPPPLLVLERG